MGENTLIEWADHTLQLLDRLREGQRGVRVLIRFCKWIDFLLLTKRPENVLAMLPHDWGTGWPNVWVGATVENQKRADERLPHLLKVPAVVRFVSMEPLLGEVDLQPWLHRCSFDDHGEHSAFCDACAMREMAASRAGLISRMTVGRAVTRSTGRRICASANSQPCVSHRPPPSSGGIGGEK